MKTRQEIKSIAKEIVRTKYGQALLPGLLLMLISYAATVVIVGPILVIPLSVGAALVYLKLWNGENTDVGTMFTSAFNENYLRKLGSMLLVGLYTWLWSLLLIVPGIIKGLSYSMTRFILAKHPNVTAQDAIRLSMRMTNGHKMEMFVLGLSFIGWELLSGLTFGLLAIFYVQPYMDVTYAGYFEELEAECLREGKVDASELNPIA